MEYKMKVEKRDNYIRKRFLNIFQDLDQINLSTGAVCLNKRVFQEIEDIFKERDFYFSLPSGKNPARKYYSISLDGDKIKLSLNRICGLVKWCFMQNIPLTWENIMIKGYETNKGKHFNHYKMWMQGSFNEWAKVGMADPLYGDFGEAHSDPRIGIFESAVGAYNYCMRNFVDKVIYEFTDREYYVFRRGFTSKIILGILRDKWPNVLWPNDTSTLQRLLRKYNQNYLNPEVAVSKCYEIEREKGAPRIFQQYPEILEYTLKKFSIKLVDGDLEKGSPSTWSNIFEDVQLNFPTANIGVKKAFKKALNDEMLKRSEDVK